jgi:hypothetical protein
MERLPALWVTKHKIKNESGFELDFTKRRFLWDMYNDLSPLQVEFKPPQIGATVKNTLKALYVAKKLGRQIIYTLPTQTDVSDMVGGSFNRIIAQNPILMDWVKEHDRVEQKSVGDSIIFYRGTFTSKSAMMVPSGLNIHDEVDASNQAVITQYETRLQAQEDGGWRWYFSHPSLSGHGVDAYWAKSDQKEWYVTCKHCGLEQYLRWEEDRRLLDNIDRTNKVFCCLECRKELDTETRINGRWKNKDGVAWDGAIAGGYEFSGWHTSQLMLYNKTAQQILEARADPLKDTQYFYNYVLGLPFMGGENRISTDQVLQNCIDVVNDQDGQIVLGMDTGLGIHFTMMNEQGVFFYDNVTEITATSTPYDTIERLLIRYPKLIVMSDQGGDLIGVRKLQAKYPGRVFLVYYNKDRKTKELYEWGEGEEYGKVRVDRNRMMTLVVEQLKDKGRIPLNGTKEEFTEYSKHFANMYREKIVVKETPGKDDASLYGAEFVWKRKGPDHYAHTLLYAYLGWQRYGGGMAKIVGEDPLAGLARGQIVEGQEVVATIPHGAFSKPANL